MGFVRRFPRLLWYVVPVLLIAAIAGAAYLLNHRSEGRILEAVGREGTSSLPSGAIVCLGRIDVEGGVVPLGFQQMGRVMQVFVHEGQMVRVGAELIRLEDEPARLQLQKSESGVQALQARLASVQKEAQQLQTRINQQRAAWEAARYRVSAAVEALRRKEELARNGLVNDTEIRMTVDQVKEFKALAQVEQQRQVGLRQQDPSLVVEEIRAELTASQTQKEQARYALKQCVLKAPQSGVVLRVFVSAGQMVDAQSQSCAVLLCPDRPLQVRAEVEQEFVERVVLGQSARVVNESGPRWEWSGRVIRVGEWYAERRTLLRQPPQSTDVPTVECLIVLDPGHPRLRIGQRVEVMIGGEPPTR